jgi:hypothetical protein
MSMSFFQRLFGRHADARQEVHPNTERIAERLLAVRRMAWTPNVGRGEGGIAASRFGGRPALRLGELHAPLCGVCSRPMPLWLQLDLKSLPDDSKALLPETLHRGLLQFFYCTREDCECADCGAFPANTVVRVHAIDGREFLRDADPADHPAQLILGWGVRAEIPGDGEYPVDAAEGITEADIGEFYSRPGALSSSLPSDKDKLLGWPDWVQGVWYPDCPECGKPMAYLFQIASNDHVEFMFGDSGVGHVFLCPTHLKRATFVWQCC